MIPFPLLFAINTEIRGDRQCLHHEYGKDRGSICSYPNTNTLNDILNILKNWPKNREKPNLIIRGGVKGKWYLKYRPINEIESFKKERKNHTVWVIEWKDAADVENDDKVDTTAASLGIPIAEWLTKITGSESIHAYAEAFADYGYTDTHVLMELTKVDLQECMEQIGVKPAHMKLILRAFEKMI